MTGLQLSLEPSLDFGVFIVLALVARLDGSGEAIREVLLVLALVRQRHDGESVFVQKMGRVDEEKRGRRTRTSRLYML